MVRTLRRLAVAGVAVTALALAPQALADGNETLGPPAVTIASGTDAVMAGVGTQAHPDTPVTLDVDVPAGATVHQVLAYWQGQMTSEFGPDRPDNEISFDGSSVTGVQVSAPTNPYLGELYWTYRADITALGLVRAGANAITVSDMNFVSNLYSPSGNKGVGLVVIYSDGSRSRLAGYVDGQDYAYAGFGAPLDTTRPQTFSFAAASRDRAATLGLLVGDTLDYNETGVAGNVISGRFSSGQTFTVVNQLQSRRGADFDAENLPITVPAGATSLTVQILSEGGDNPASFAWIGAGLTLDDEAPPEEPCEPQWGSHHKWAAWVAWWKRWLAREYGHRNADRYASFWEGGKHCTPPEDDCRDRGFFFGRHRDDDCKPDGDDCKDQRYWWGGDHGDDCKPGRDDCKPKKASRSGKHGRHDCKDRDDKHHWGGKHHWDSGKNHRR